MPSKKCCDPSSTPVRSTRICDSGSRHPHGRTTRRPTQLFRIKHHHSPETCGETSYDDQPLIPAGTRLSFKLRTFLPKPRGPLN